MAELPKRRRRATGARALKAAWWLCIVVILTVPGMFALMVGTAVLGALLITVFTALCVWIAWILIGIR